MRLGGDGREVKRPPSKLHAQLVNRRRFEYGSKRASDGLIAIEVVLESGGQVEAVVQRRLVEQPSIANEIADEHCFLLVEAAVQPQEAVVIVVCAQNTTQGRFLRQTIDGFHLINEFDVLEHSGIVERRFTAALEFKVAENKSLVFLNRTPNCRAELILPQIVRTSSLQEIDSIQFVVAKILVSDSVPFIGAATCDDVHDASARAAKLYRIIGVDDAEFQHRFLWRCAALDARGCRYVVGAVDSDEIVMDVLARKRQLGYRLDNHVGVSGRGIPDGNGGGEQRKVDKFAPVHRQIDNLVFRDHRADLGAGRLSKFCSCFDFHFLNHFPRRESESELRGLPDLERDVFSLFSKSREFNHDLIFTSRERAYGVFAVIGTLCGAREPRGQIGSRHRGFGHTSAGSIGYLSRERGIDRLAADRRRQN